jgi:hypothetical protein
LLNVAYYELAGDWSARLGLVEESECEFVLLGDAPVQSSQHGRCLC